MWNSASSKDNAVAATYLFIKSISAKVTKETVEETHKNHPDLFLSLLQKQSEMPFVPVNLDTILLGNPTAAHTPTMVTSPFCQPQGKLPR